MLILSGTIAALHLYHKMPDQRKPRQPRVLKSSWHSLPHIPWFEQPI